MWKSSPKKSNEYGCGYVLQIMNDKQHISKHHPHCQFCGLHLQQTTFPPHSKLQLYTKVLRATSEFQNGIKF